jgi:hypothetical protein
MKLNDNAITDPELKRSLIALERAAHTARLVAIQTNTSLVILKNNQIVRLDPAQLRQDLGLQPS